MNNTSLGKNRKPGTKVVDIFGPFLISLGKTWKSGQITSLSYTLELLTDSIDRGVRRERLGVIPPPH